MAHDFSDQGTVVSGPAASTRPGAQRLPEMPRPDFYLMHHPERWEPVETEGGDWEWLPKLKRLLLVPGVNGVRATAGGVDDSHARINFENQGWHLLPRDLGYVVRYPCRTAAPSHYTLWDTPVVMGRRVVLRHDTEGYNQFRRELVTSGTIPPPEPEALEVILNDLQHRIDRNSAQIHVPLAKAVVDKATAKRAGARKAATKAAKKPAPRKRRTTKAARSND